MEKKQIWLEYHLIKVVEAYKDLIQYVGKVRLLKAVFSNYASGASKTWEKGLDEALDTLSEREKRILEMRFGLTGEPKTLEEVGREFGVTRERIRSIEQKALRKLRHPSRKKVLLGMSWQMAIQESKLELLERHTQNEVLKDCGMPTRIVNTLQKSGYQSYQDVKNVSDKELLKIKGIGVKTVSYLRKYLK